MSKNIKIYGFRPYAEPIIKTGKSFKYDKEGFIRIYDNNDKLSLCELELIEPELWFRNNKKAAKILAENISNLINSKPPQI